MKNFAWMLNKHAEGPECVTACAQARDRFQRFWNSRGAALYDVINESDGDPSEDRQRYDIQLRLDRIFAVSPPHKPLDPARKKRPSSMLARMRYLRGRLSGPGWSVAEMLRARLGLHTDKTALKSDHRKGRKHVNTSQ